MIPLTTHVHSIPSDQNALDIFANQWTSSLPAEWSHLRAGTLPLFVDPRIFWALQELGGVVGKTVLELGPLEGAHSYILDRAGASDILAIESNASAFLRCLILKEICKIHHVRYLCGDFMQHLETTPHRYDVVIASGVLYHQIDPMRLLSQIARASQAVYIWTHYFDAALVAKNPRISHKIGAAQERKLLGLTYSQVEFRYEKALEWSGFSGGAQTACYWLTKDDIFRGLRYFGFKHISVAFEESAHENGPSLALVATKEQDLLL